MSKSDEQYRVVFENNSVKKGWDQLKVEFPDKVDECIRFLKASPADRRNAIGKLKKLRGKYKGILQYDITKDEYRVWYIIDKQSKIVVIRYAGAHPE